MRIFQVDAFTDTPFSGNPAGVCLLDEPKDDGWMQAVAAEMNLSETAFLLMEKAGYRLRWFTPTIEVELCGHATLSTAHVLYEIGEAEPAEPIEFQSRSGTLGARWDSDHDRVVLDLPARPTEPAPIPSEISRALGIQAVAGGRVGKLHLIEIASEEAVRSMKPDFQTLRTFPGRGVMVTSRASTRGFDFVSRYFAPWIGIDEDPVTGSAHCALAPYWNARLGKTEMLAYQASPRGGVVHVRLDGDRVHLGGQARTVIVGELLA